VPSSLDHTVAALVLRDVRLGGSPRIIVIKCIGLPAVLGTSN